VGEREGVPQEKGVTPRTPRGWKGGGGFDRAGGLISYGTDVVAACSLEYRPDSQQFRVSPKDPSDALV
jgi:hypothetical protein